MPTSAPSHSDPLQSPHLYYEQVRTDNFLGLRVCLWASQVVLVVKNPAANTGDLIDVGPIPGLGRSPREGHGNPLQYSCLEHYMDRGAWWATVHEVAKSRTWLSMQALAKRLTAAPARVCCCSSLRSSNLANSQQRRLGVTPKRGRGGQLRARGRPAFTQANSEPHTK